MSYYFEHPTKTIAFLENRRTKMSNYELKITKINMKIIIKKKHTKKETKNNTKTLENFLKENKKIKHTCPEYDVVREKIVEFP